MAGSGSASWRKVLSLTLVSTVVGHIGGFLLLHFNTPSSGSLKKVAVTMCITYVA